MATDTDTDLGSTCEKCQHAKDLLSQATYVDPAIVSFNCGHGITEIIDDTDVLPQQKMDKPMSINAIIKELKIQSCDDLPEAVNSLDCLLCDESYPPICNSEKSPLLSHLLAVHRMVIADVDKIADFNKYIRYWKKKFSSTDDVTKYTVVINSNTTTDDAEEESEAEPVVTEKYFLLTDFLPEDERLRKQLNNEKLCSILDEQRVERCSTDFSRACLFCKVPFKGNRAGLFKHMAIDHSFNVGNPDNIVHAEEFLDLLKSRLDSLLCLFCDKDFKDWSILKDHMRKKGHKRIDPKNKEYDKYYLINYLDPGKNWKEVQNEPEYEKEDCFYENEIYCNGKEWNDWIEEEDEKTTTLCLFCNKVDNDVHKILSHMKHTHSFDLKQLKKKLGLSYYHQVKIINYIRKQIHNKCCPLCLKELKTTDELNEHLFTERHYGVPEKRTEWDVSKYFYPTFDDDNLLCCLVDDDENDDTEEDENQNRKC